MNQDSETTPNESADSREEYERARKENRTRACFYGAGIVFPNIVGGMAFSATQFMLPLFDDNSATSEVGRIFLGSQMVVVPIGMGIIASFFWRKLNLDIGELGYSAVYVTLLSLIGAAVFFGEGIICILMISPLLFLLIWAGACLGKLLWKRNSWLGASALPVFVLLVFFDARTPHHHAAVVRDEILIQAPPARVWKYIAAYPKIKAPPDFWLWKMGLPYPIQSTADGAFVGARRDCRFSGNVVFEEKIVEAKAPHLLTFDVTKQPDHPEITGHFNLDRGRFELRDNGDGTTTLIGTTWYRLHIYPTQYFDLWAAAIIRRVHFRVFEQVKKLSERNA